MTNLNEKYTFESFIVGSSNRFAHAAALAAAEEIGTRYNPLFIYGSAGLGKTHLTQAIGHLASSLNPAHKVTYVTSELFTDEFVAAIRYDRLTNFKNKYRQADILLVDDVQFFVGKDSTLDEFHHTFNFLFEANKQIVLTSDRQPFDIKLDKRLQSRFSCGLTTSISPPDLETRIAILQHKADHMHFSMDQECFTYIADHITDNIRELEGALNRVIAFSTVHHIHRITYDQCVEALTPIFPQGEQKIITSELIQEKVANYFNIKIEDLCAKRRTMDVTVPRQIAMYLCTQMTDNSLTKIGDLFGGRDHSTVINSRNKIGDYLRSDQQISLIVNKIMEEIKK